MAFRKNHIFSALTVIILAATFLYSCSPVDLEFDPTPSPGRTDNNGSVRVTEDYRNVFIMYAMGFNNLRGYLAEDIRDILSSPMMSSGRDIIIILSHIADRSEGKTYDPSIPVSPTFTKISRNFDGSIQKDTLTIATESFTIDENTILASTETLQKSLEYIKENFHAKKYGILLSSHGSGWAPSGYISNPDAFDPNDFFSSSWQAKKRIPVYWREREDKIPVKTIGVHNITTSSALEMEITDLADAIPFKLDYVIFDACFMGGIEVAYELRNVTDKIIFSQTEILADGMDYKTMCSYLFAAGEPDLEGFCQRYYNYYNARSGLYQSATISLIDCSKLEALAQTTKEILTRYRSGLNSLQKTRDVQQYYQNAYKNIHQWFYDFGDIIEKCGPSEEDLKTFNESLSAAVKYKAATKRFMNDYYIKTNSGLSMYLPFTTGRDYLHSFYKTLEWNQAVGLIQ